jgi:hypothetical protein
VIGAVCSCLSIAAAVLTATAAHLNNDDDPMLWTLAVVALLLLALLVWALVRVRARGWAARRGPGLVGAIATGGRGVPAEQGRSSAWRRRCRFRVPCALGLAYAG